MTKRISRTAKLPSWFDKEKYARSSNLSAVEWALNLSIRNRVLASLLASLRGWHFKTKEEAIKYVEEEISLIKTFGALAKPELDEEYEHERWNHDLQELRPGFGLIYSLPLERAVDIYDSIRMDTELRNSLAILDYKDVFAHEWKGMLQQGDEFWLNWYENYFRKATYDDVYSDYISFSPHVCVDLNATDEMLIEGFKNWLQSARKNMDKDDIPPPGKLSKNLTQKWIDSAILPYLDLRIYEHLEGVDLPFHVIGEAIFPSAVEIDTTEAVRKTTRRYAEEALKHSNIILRWALIAEQREKAE